VDLGEPGGNFATPRRILRSVTTWTAKQVAAAAGVKSQSARDLVAKLGLASVGRDQDTGAKLYDVDQAKAALAARPGRGNRSDLGKRKRPFTQAELREVNGWMEYADKALTRADTLGPGRATTVLETTSTQLRRLVEAARTYPLFAMHPDWSNDHRRVYSLAPEMGRQLVHLAGNAHHLGDVHPGMWDEAEALLARLVELVDLAAAGLPMPPRNDPVDAP
jgi:hypothetical protein